MINLNDYEYAAVCLIIKEKYKYKINDKKNCRKKKKNHRQKKELIFRQLNIMWAKNANKKKKKSPRSHSFSSRQE